MPYNWVTHTVLCTLSIAGLIAGLCGKDAGWASAQQSMSPSKWAPEISLDVSIGWWGSTARVRTGFVPVMIELLGKGGRTLGAVTASILILGACAAVLTVANTIASLLATPLPWPVRLSPLRKYQLCGWSALCAVIAAAALYAGLAIHAHTEIKKKISIAEVEVWPFPDWAAASALAGGLSLLAATYRLSKDLVVDPLEGYLPL